MQLRPSTRATVVAGSAAVADNVAGRGPGTHAAERKRPSFGRRRILGLILLILVVLGIVLIILALPLVHARSHAKAAQAELEAAKASLSAQDFPTARQHIQRARADVDQADSDVHGLGAGVWAHLPVAGGAVKDARRLVDALSQATRVAQIGAKIYPNVAGPKASLVQGEKIDLPMLNKVVSATSKIGGHLDAALRDLHAVSGSTPLVGGAVASARDSALDQLQTLSDSYARTLPLLKATPAVLGADGPRTYLLAMLNPAELRYSGGGALSFTTMRFDNGQATFGQSQNVDQVIRKGAFLRWPGVPGNPLHRTPDRLTNSTFSPYWSVSGEELMRAWKVAYDQQLDGVIAVDLQALAGLFAVTGPVDIPGHAPLTSDTLVPALAGSYRTTTKEERLQVNRALVPSFRKKFFEGGSIQQKLSSLLTSANGRHFATYFRDPEVQQHFATAGLSGNLSDSPNDYIGVFSQNLNGSKTDYFQHRTVDSKVNLHADGSAWVTMRVHVNNASEPYAGPPPVPAKGYLTAQLGTSIGVFLPAGATLGSVEYDGHRHFPTPLLSTVSGIFNRPFVHHNVHLNAGQTQTYTLRYTVPHAVQEVGGLKDYRLSIDPQDTVVPEGVTVTVNFPGGATPSALPVGWVSNAPGSATYVNAAVSSSMTLELPVP